MLVGAEVDLTIYDPYIKDGSTVESLEQSLIGATAVVIATGHDEFAKNMSPDRLLGHGIKVVVDGRNILKHEKDDLIKTGVLYRGIGV